MTGPNDPDDRQADADSRIPHPAPPPPYRFG